MGAQGCFVVATCASQLVNTLFASLRAAERLRRVRVGPLQPGDAGMAGRRPTSAPAAPRAANGNARRFERGAAAALQVRAASGRRRVHHPRGACGDRGWDQGGC